MSKGNIRDRRIRAGIPGGLLCRKAGIVRSRLSDIERCYVTPRPDEIQRLAEALDELIAGKSVIEAAAAEVGWPSGVGAF